MKRAKFSLSHYKLLTCDMGELIPVQWQEVLPGDTFQMSSSALIRLSPLLAPVMHPVVMRIHHWFVPLRLIWQDFEDFITGGPDGNDASVAPTKVFGASNPAIGSIGDYFGVPTGLAGGITVSVLPFRAYNLIWNEWYRDQDLQTELALVKTSGVDATTTVALQKVGWEKDYFTSSRPWPVKGAEVTIPLSDDSTPPFRVKDESGDIATVKSNVAGTGLELSPAVTGEDDLDIVQQDFTITVRDLRESLAIQRYQEARARYGSRYTEYLAYLGVRAADSRLQRPEYLGGGKQIVQMSEVLQTGVTTSGATAGVGNLTGHGIGAMRSRRFRRYFSEHGILLSLMSVKPVTMYSQGVHRRWRRATREDYFQKELQTIGQQEVFNREIYAAGASPDAVFGYQDRYDEYRRSESSVAGEFRTTLNFWHMAREFTSAPALNAAFVESAPTKRIHQVTTADALQCMVSHSIQARRMLSKTGVSRTF